MRSSASKHSGGAGVPLQTSAAAPTVVAISAVFASWATARGLQSMQLLAANMAAHAPRSSAPVCPHRFGPLLQWQVAPPKLKGVSNLQYAIVSFRKLQDAQAAFNALNHQVRGVGGCRLDGSQSCEPNSRQQARGGACIFV